MGLDALVVSLNPTLAQPLPRFSEFENTIYHLSKRATDLEQTNAKEAIKRIREDIDAGIYIGRTREAFERIGERLDHIDYGPDRQYRGVLHAFHDYARAGLLAGLEAYERRDAREARELLIESNDVARTICERYSKELSDGFDDSPATKAYAYRTSAFASILLAAVQDKAYMPVRPFAVDNAETAVLAYARGHTIPMRAKQAIVRAHNLARLHWGEDDVPKTFERLSRLL